MPKRLVFEFDKKGDLARELRSIRSELSKVQRASRQTNQSLGRIKAPNLKTLALQVGGLIAAFQGLRLAVRAVSTNVLGFQDAFAEARSIMSVSADQAERLEDALLGISVRTSKNPTESARGFYQVISAGVQDTADALKVLEASSLAGVAGLSDTFTAVDVITTVLNSYKLEAEDAIAVSDLLFNTVKQGKINFTQLASELGKVTPIAEAAGVDIVDLTAAIAALTKTVRPDIAFTALRSFLTGVTAPDTGVQQLAESLGLDFTGRGLRERGLLGVLEDIREATGGDFDVISQLFPNVRAITAVLNLAGSQFQEFRRIRGEAFTSGGSTQAAFGEIQNTFGQQLRTLVNTLRSGLIAAMDSVTDRLGFGLGRINRRLQEAFSPERIEATVRRIVVVIRDAILAIAGFIDDLIDKVREFVFVLKAGLTQLPGPLGGNLFANAFPEAAAFARRSPTEKAFELAERFRGAPRVTLFFSRLFDRIREFTRPDAGEGAGAGDADPGINPLAFRIPLRVNPRLRRINLKATTARPPRPDFGSGIENYYDLRRAANPPEDEPEGRDNRRAAQIAAGVQSTLASLGTVTGNRGLQALSSIAGVGVGFTTGGPLGAALAIPGALGGIFSLFTGNQEKQIEQLETIARNTDDQRNILQRLLGAPADFTAFAGGAASYAGVSSASFREFGR